jgi:peptidoglycan hydrolase-like protein with peptidoglycan-binding domain
VAADGKFGPNTHDAVKKFQRERDLPVDGIVGARTWAALEHDREAKPKPKPVPATGLFAAILNLLRSIFGRKETA